MGTVAYQSMWPIIRRREEAEEKKRQAEESAGATSREKPKKRPGLLGVLPRACAVVGSCGEKLARLF